jgi:renalase
MAEPSFRSLGRVAIVGAGVAGLACARTLLERGVEVSVFDKGKRPGGRVASHRSPELDVDLGASYFTVRDERFGRVVSAWIRDGVVAPWDGRMGALSSGAERPVETPPLTRFVGTPSMSSIARHLAREVVVNSSHRVDAIERKNDRFRLFGAIGEAGVTLGPRDASALDRLVDVGDFDVLLMFLPADQALSLVTPLSPSLSEAVSRVSCEPCLALGFVPENNALREFQFDGLFVGRDGDPDRRVCWLARESSKPQRRTLEHETWMVHASPEWSRANLREPEDVLKAALLGEVARLLKISPFGAKATILRRWAFARAPAASLDAPLFEEDIKLGLGGDWSLGGRVEGAFLSGVSLARRLLGIPNEVPRD